MSKELQPTYELIVMLAVSFRAIVDDLHEHLAQAGYSDVRPAHGFLFQLLSQGAATGSDAAEHLAVTKQAASQMIEELEKKGYVSRRPHPADSRAKLVELTEKGWGCIRETEFHFRHMESRIGELLGEHKLDELRRHLRQIVLNLGNGQAPAFRPVW